MIRLRIQLTALILFTAFSGAFSDVYAADPVKPIFSEPSQKERFFSPERLSLMDTTESVKPVIEPHFSVSRDFREDDLSFGVKQTTETVFGEAGGKFNLLGDISLTSFAKIPVFTKGTVGSNNSPDGTTNSELFQRRNKLSWRSELGVPLKKGVDLNFFYDNSLYGKADRPGIDERDEKFGTRFIFKFK